MREFAQAFNKEYDETNLPPELAARRKDFDARKYSGEDLHWTPSVDQIDRQID